MTHGRRPDRRAPRRCIASGRPPRATVLRSLTILVVVALFATACGSAGDDREDERSGAEAVVERLAEAGIAVYADAADTEPLIAPAEPVSPMRLLEWQVRNLSLEVEHGGGMTGTDLDATVVAGSAESIEVTSSGLIAGWAEHAGTPAANLAAELLGEAVDQPEQAVFPDLVLVLFTADVATVGSTLPEPTGDPGDPSGTAPTAPLTAQPAADRHPASRALSIASRSAPAQPANTPCSTVLDFVNRTIASVFNAIGHVPAVHVSGLDIFGDFLNLVGNAVVGGINFVIDGAHFVLDNGVRILIAPVMAIVARVAGIAGTIAQITSTVRPWALRMAADPTENRKAVGDEAPLTGNVTARVDLGGLDEWPPFLADCAQRSGVTLPPLRPAGNPVTWTLAGGPDLATQDGADAHLTEDGSATLHYRTGVEPAYDNPTEAVGRLSVTAVVQRDDVTRLRDAFVRLVHEGITDLAPPLGSVISPLVMPYVQPIITGAFDALAHLRDTTGTTTILVTYHTPGEPEPPSTGTTPPSGRRLPAECPAAAALAPAAGVPLEGPGVQDGFPPIFADAVECDYAYEQGTELGLLTVVYLPADSRGVDGLVTRYEDYLAANGAPAPSPCRRTDVPGADSACIQTGDLPPAAYLYMASGGVHVLVVASLTSVSSPPPPERAQEIATSVADVTLRVA